MRIYSFPAVVVTSFFVVVFAAEPARCAADDQTITQAELVRRTQALYDAVAPGDPTLWKKYFADDCIVADEKGRLMDKSKLVADITPMPKGYTGSIKVVDPQSRIVGDTAVLSYACDETEDVFGQHLTARYHEIDTWLRRNGVWQIVASQVMRYYEDPAMGKADPKKFADFAGTYELAPGQTRKVTTDAGNLFVERNGKREQLFPEAPDVFFRKGVEGRVLFGADDKGKINSLIDRRNNEDIVWRKTG